MGWSKPGLAHVEVEQQIGRPGLLGKRYLNCPLDGQLDELPEYGHDVAH